MVHFFFFTNLFFDIQLNGNSVLSATWCSLVALVNWVTGSLRRCTHSTIHSFWYAEYLEASVSFTPLTKLSQSQIISVLLWILFVLQGLIFSQKLRGLAERLSLSVSGRTVNSLLQQRICVARCNPALRCKTPLFCYWIVCFKDE